MLQWQDHYEYNMKAHYIRGRVWGHLLAASDELRVPIFMRTSLHDNLGSDPSLIKPGEAILRKGYFRPHRVQEPPPTGFEPLFYRYKMVFVLLTHGK